MLLEGEIRRDYFRFDFYLKKITKLKLFLKTKPNQTEADSNRPDSIQFGFLGQKPVQTDLAQFFQFDSVFSNLSSVRFGFFDFRLIKPNRTSWVF